MATTTIRVDSTTHAELVALAEAESEREPPAFEYRRMTRKEAVEA